MAILHSNYKPPFWYRNAHWQTIFPAVFRTSSADLYEREKIFTTDGDFLNMDRIRSGSRSCVILSHGLEGASDRGYMTGMARYLSSKGFDICAWNYRGCGDEMNNNLRMYHSGFTSDLKLVVDHIANSYDRIILIGFSAGGNISLKYIGEDPDQVHPAIKACVAISAPTDLKACSEELEKPSNFIYQKRFLKLLGEKIATKEKQYPDLVSTHKYDKITTLKEFDDRYTAPFFGFKNAHDYYEQCSSQRFIPSIRVKTLILTAKNDPFMPEECYPIELCKGHKYVDLEIPDEGGHVGFFQHGQAYWSEIRAAEFIMC